MQRRRFLLALLAGGSAMTLSACDDMPASAVAPWQGPEASLREPRLRALSWALLAPNPHNQQPWIADLRQPREVSLRLDPERLLPATDPYGRQILIGCGAFIELLRMAAAAEGEKIAVTPFPDGAPPTDAPLGALRVALIRWTGEGAAADPLFASAQQRRTNRAPYGPQGPAADVLQRLGAAVQTPGIEARFATDATLVREISALAAAAYRTEFATPAAFAESARLVRVGASEIAREPSGIAVHGTAIWWARSLGLMSRDDAFNPASQGFQQALARILDSMQATPAWSWLVSTDNARTTQLAAGRAYLRLTLAATAEGVATHPNAQATQEFAEMRPHAEALNRLTATAAPARVQMLTRLGYGPETPPAPRRPLQAFVLT